MPLPFLEFCGEHLWVFASRIHSASGTCFGFFPLLEHPVSPPSSLVVGVVLAAMGSGNSDIIRYLLFKLRKEASNEGGSPSPGGVFTGLKRELHASKAIDLRPSTERSWLRVGEYVDDEDIITLVRAFAEIDLPTLTRLDLSHNRIGDEGAVALAQWLSQGQFPQLTYLDLSHTRIGEEGLIALAQVLERGYLPGLTWLDLSHNFFSSASNGEKEGNALAKALLSGKLPNLYHLGLPPCNLDLVVNAFFESRIRQLRYLHLSGYLPDAASVRMASIGELFEIVKRMPLEHIYLRRCGLTWDVMEDFTRALVSKGEKLQNLQHLDLSENNLGRRGVVALGKVMKDGLLSNLTHLSLGLCGIEEIYMLKALEDGIRSGNMAQLTHLDFSSNKLGFLGTCSLVNMIEEGRLSNLLHLNLSDCNMRMVAGLGTVRSAKPLRTRSYLELAERDVLDFIASLKKRHLTELRVLDLSFNKLSTQGCVALADVIKGGDLPSLHQLQLCCCGIKDKGILSLVEAMQGGHLTEVHYLDLGFNKFDNPGVNAIAGALKKNLLPKLRYLNLYLFRLGSVPFSKDAVASTYKSIYGVAGEACRSLTRDNDMLMRLSFFWAQSKRHDRLVRREDKMAQMADTIVGAFSCNDRLRAIIVGLGEYDSLFEEKRGLNLQVRVQKKTSKDETSLATRTLALTLVILSLGLYMYKV